MPSLAYYYIVKLCYPNETIFFFINRFLLIHKFPINNPSFTSSKPGFSQINTSIVSVKNSFSLGNPVLLQDYRFFL